MHMFKVCKARAHKERKHGRTLDTSACDMNTQSGLLLSGEPKGRDRCHAGAPLQRCFMSSMSAVPCYRCVTYSCLRHQVESKDQTPQPLSSAAAYIIDSPECVFVWLGAACSEAHKATAERVVTSLQVIVVL